MKQAEWYVNWFNSPYYHLLYNKRNVSEANLLIDNLCDAVHIGSGEKVWDMACGKGRHAIALSKKGLDVTGSDLSENSIKEASKHNAEHLHFFVHDMREPFKQKYFKAVFNLFTSFGYFEDEEDNYKVFRNAAEALEDDGYFMIDYFNSNLLRAGKDMQYTEQRGEIKFEIFKKFRPHEVQKRIEFSDAGHDYYFEEKVTLFTKEELEKFGNTVGLKTEAVYGNYYFEPYHEEKSERLILIFRK